MSKSISIVTGATGGLGKVFVQYLLEEVDEIWAIARNTDKLKLLKEEYGEKIILIPGDLSQNQILEQMDQLIHQSNPTIRYLINNAGGGKIGKYDEFSITDIETHIKTHCTAMVILCKLCIPYMQKGSHIINMSSQSAFQPVPYINLYAASKAFVRSYSRALNVELEGTGIVATVACPGWIKTDLLKNERNGKQIRFPAIALPEDVVLQILKDARSGKDMSVYGTFVKFQHLLTKILPHKLVMKSWIKQIKEYI